MPTIEDIDSLQRSLAAAEQDLEDRSGVGSATSEGRDNVHSEQQVHEDLERHSTASLSGGSSGTMRSVPGQKQAEVAPPPIAAAPRICHSSSGGSGNNSSGSGAPSSGAMQQLLVARQKNRQPEVVQPLNQSDISSGSLGPSSGPFPSSGSMGPTSSDTAFIDSFSATQTSALDRIMADIKQKHGKEVASMQVKLDGNEDTRRLLADDMARLQKQLTSNAGMEELIDAARTATDVANSERDDLKDVIAGMAARQEVHVRRLVSDVSKTKTENRAASGQRVAAVTGSQEELKRMLEANKEALRKGKKDVTELEYLSNSSDACRLHSVNEMSHLQGLLDAANRRIARDRRSDAMLPGDTQNIALDEANTHKLEELLNKSEESDRSLNAELAEVRLSMFNMNRGHNEEVANMQSQLDMLNIHAGAPGGLKLSSQGGLPLKIGKPLLKKSPLSLGKIEEEDGDETADLISVSHSVRSGQISSDGIGGVGDLKDFEEDDDRGPNTKDTDTLYKCIETLKGELNDVANQHQEVQDDMTEREALNLSKLRRIMKNLSDSQTNSRVLEDEMRIFKQSGKELGLKNTEELLELQRLLLDSQEGRIGDVGRYATQTLEQGVENAADLASCERQLETAKQLRNDCAKQLHDKKIELATVELQHAQEVADLMQKLKNFEQSGGGSGLYPEVDGNILEQLQQTEQERNMLRNELEWKEVQFNAQLENIIPHQVELKKLEKLQEELANQQELNKQVQKSIDEVDEQLKERRAAVRSASNSLPAAPAPASSSSTPWYLILRCPSRAQDQQAAVAQATRVSCQHACWQILMAMPDVVALFCSAKDLEILEASKNAYVVWGSSALQNPQGSTLLDLSEKSMRTWLQKRLEPNISRGATPGSESFSLWQLPCVSFCDQVGTTFDSSVVCASMPEEPRHAKCSAILVILDVMEVRPEEPSHRPQHVGPSISGGSEREPRSASQSQKQQRKRGSRGTPSGISQSSDDVTANDSISCVLAQHLQ